MIKDLLYKIKAIYQAICRFFYYGKVGMKCYAFDASAVYDLEYAHMKRVKDFMMSDKTHLMWNDSNDTKDMKRLIEFTELSRLMSREVLCMSNYMRLPEHIRDNHEWLYNRPMNKLKRIALKKDRLLEVDRKKRYHQLREKYLETFWD